MTTVRLFGFVFVALAIGCGPTVESASKSAAQGAVTGATRSTLENFEDPKTRERAAALVGTPEVQRAIRDLASAIAAGTVVGLSDARTEARTEELVHTITRGVVGALTEETKGLAPAADALTRRVVDSAFAEALSPAHEAALTRFSQSIIAASMSTAAEQLPTTMAPAMRKALVEQLGHGFAEVIKSPDVKGALVETTNDVARQAVLGSNEGLAILEQKRKRDQGGKPLGAIGAFFATRTWMIGLLVAIVLFGLPILWLLRDRSHLRQQWFDNERRTARADAILSAIEASADKGLSSDMLGELRRQLHEPGETPPHHA